MNALLVKFVGETADKDQLRLGFMYGFELSPENIDALRYAVEDLGYPIDEVIFCETKTSFICAWDSSKEYAVFENFRSPEDRMFDYHIKPSNEKRKWYRFVVDSYTGNQHLIRCSKKGKPKKPLPKQFIL